MTAYDPQPLVTIAGVDYTSDTINLVTTYAGRSSVDDQPRAGYAKLSLIVLDNSYPAIQLNDLVKISIVDSVNTDIHVFTGYITDVVRRMQNAGNISQAIQIDLLAAGPLARLSKRESAANYPKEYDGDRITQILEDVFATSWNEVAPSTLTWAAVDPTKTWDTYDPGYVGFVETPGDYELHDYSGGAVEALSLTRLVANSALGILYETGDGLVNYDAATSRVDRVTATGFTEVSADYLDTRSIASDSRTGDLINQISITYKNNAFETGDDTNSIATYGLFAANRGTYLEDQTQVNQQIAFYLETRSIPRINLADISIPLHNPNLPTATRDALLGVFCGFPINIPDLPTAIYNAPFEGFVEEYTWRITRYTADLTMGVSEYGLSAIEQAWLQVNATETWQTIQPTMTWEDARVIY